MTRPFKRNTKIHVLFDHHLSTIIKAGAQHNQPQLNKRVCVINNSSLIAASLVFFFGGGLTIMTGEMAILYPAVPEVLLFGFVIWLNYKRAYFLSALLWHFTFCASTFIFGSMLSTVIDATHMAGFLIGAPLLIFRQKDRNLLVSCIFLSVIALLGIELNNNLAIFTPLEITASLYPVFRVATWLTVILLNVVVILFYLNLNNTLMSRLKSANSKLLRTNKKLAKASAYKTIYVNETNHELRTPLNALYAITQLLDDENITTDDLRKMHQSIGHSVNHALEIINNVLELAKIESGKQPPVTVECIHIRNWLTDLSRIYAYQASGKNIQIITRVDDLVPTEINFIRVQVTQVLNNLVTNAIKFTGIEGKICIAVNTDVSFWSISVQDDGVGMDAATLAKVFEPYYTSGPNNPNGTGLGMHIARKLVERIGGTLLAESKPGEGSKFTIKLPVGLTATPEVIRPIVHSTVVFPAKVLLIEDDLLNRVWIGKLLQSIGCVVETAATGQEGLIMAQNTKPDIIFMDMSLPDVHGNILLRKFKSTPEINNIPVIVLSGSIFQEERDLAIELGAAHYVEKPVNLDRMCQLIQSMAHS